MKKSDQLKLERTTKLEAQKKLVDTARAEQNRDMNDAENASFDALQEEIATLNRSILRAEQAEANEALLAGANRIDNNGTEGNEKPKERRSFSLNRAIRALVNGSPLDGAELEANQRGIEAARSAGIGVAPSSFTVPLFDTRADGQTVTADSGAYGGNTVATDVVGPIDFLRPQPVVESLGAVFLTGLQGNVQFPKNNGGVTAVWEGEVDAVANTKTAWGKIEMKPKRLAVSVLVSLQNLMQSSFDMEMYTMGEIRKAIENEIDKAALVGPSGGDSPTGILNASGTNSVAVGTNGGPLTFPIAVSLETEVFVDNANGARMNYVSNSKVRGKAKTTVLESGQAAYLLQNNEINGYPFANSNHIPSNLTKGTTNGTASAMIFGDFSKLVVGQWGFMDISVDDKSRKKEGYIEITANVYLDVALLEPTAFTVCKDITTA
jgi:HK97 family phage major capsid protein